jgi:hypothetical protein
MKKEIKLASVYDEAIEAQQNLIQRLRKYEPAANDPRTEGSRETIAEILEKAFKQNAALMTGRAKDDEWQAAAIKDRFSEPVFNADHWRQIAWIDRRADFHKAAESTTLHLQYKHGGSIAIEPERITYDERAAVKKEAIEHGMKHAATAWQGEAVELYGRESFKATAWAYAQIHGVKIANYEPEGNALMLANKIIADRKAEEAKRPPNNPPRHGKPPLDLAA